MKKRHLLLIGTAFTLASCSNQTKSSKEHLVFRYNESDNISSLDPAFARNKANIWAQNQIFNSLVQFDDDLKIKPDLAKNWEISNDLLEYKFTIRNNVNFHKHSQFKTPDSTRFVKAQDVEYSFKRILNPKIASPGRWVFDKVDSFKAVNDSIFSIKLKEPFPAFLGLLGMRYCSIVPHEIVDFYGNEFRSHPIGTGPFYFKAWDENTKLVLRKNPLFFENDEKGNQLPYLEAVAITFLPDKQSEFLLFIQGKLDYLNDIEDSYKDELLTPSGKLREKYKSNFNFNKTPYLNSEYLGFYMDQQGSPLQNINFRKAINYAFDRKAMITYLRNGIGFPATNGFIPRGIEGYNNQKGFYHDIDLAKKYITKYQQETGDQNPSIRLATNSNYLSICEYIQREVKKIGVDIIIDVLPASTLRKQKNSGELEIFRASWIADYPDAENFMLPFYSPKFTPNGPNYTHFKNETFDLIYQESFNEPDIDKRKLLYQKLDSIIIANAPIIPLFYDEAVRFTPKSISGLSNNAQNFLYLKKVKKLPK